MLWARSRSAGRYGRPVLRREGGRGVVAQDGRVVPDDRGSGRPTVQGWAAGLRLIAPLSDPELRSLLDVADEREIIHYGGQ